MHPATEPFLVKPYLQLGDAPREAAAESLQLLWHTDSAEGQWLVEVKADSAKTWSKMAAPRVRTVPATDVPAHAVYQSALTGLAPGKPFQYRVLRGSDVLFSAQGTARKSADQPYQFVVFGDCGADTKEQRMVAARAFEAKPDFLFITGDIVYTRGRITEYRTKFFPIYNNETSSPAEGAPLMRSVPFLAAAGNHDVGGRNLSNAADGLAYFLYWSEPLNGPEAFPYLKAEGDTSRQQAFLAAAGGTFPRMANYSFDYGNLHWTVLDSNPYVDWHDPALRDWVAKDIAASKATWHFVAFHHPGFQSAHTHFNDQQMRALADIFEAGHVDVVFAGHVHNYQRSFPMKFKATRQEKLVISGEWILDQKFDGQRETKPDGVIYIVTGAGGAHLYDGDQQNDPKSWQGFTTKFVSQVNSLTNVHVSGRKLAVRQIAADGVELDAFTITK